MGFTCTQVLAGQACSVSPFCSARWLQLSCRGHRVSGAVGRNLGASSRGWPSRTSRPGKAALLPYQMGGTRCRGTPTGRKFFSDTRLSGSGRRPGKFCGPPGRTPRDIGDPTNPKTRRTPWGVTPVSVPPSGSEQIQTAPTAAVALTFELAFLRVERLGSVLARLRWVNHHSTYNDAPLAWRPVRFRVGTVTSPCPNARRAFRARRCPRAEQLTVDPLR